MIPDSMNPRQMSENILELQRQIKEAGSELPTPEAGDVGKILKVGSEGYELATEYSYTPPAYSTTETATGQKWIDGKDIYFRVYSGTFEEITSTRNVLLENVPIIPIFGFVKTTVEVTRVGFIELSLNYNPTSGALYVRNVTTMFSETPYMAIIYYTKPDSTPNYVPAPDNDTRSVNETIKEVTEEPVQETKTTRKRSTSSK